MTIPLLQVISAVVVLHLSNGSEEDSRVLVSGRDDLQRHDDAARHALEKSSALAAQSRAKALRTTDQ